MKKLFNYLSKNRYLSIVIIIALVNIIVRIFFIKTPTYWDEANYFSCVSAIVDNNLNPFVSCQGYKPPVMFEPVAIFFKLFYPSVIWGHLLIYFLSSLSLIFCFLLGKKIFNERIALYATISLLFFPLFIAQSFLYQDPIPQTALLLITLYFYFSDKKIPYLIVGSLMVLTKEPLVFIPIILLIYDFIKNKDKIHDSIIWERLFLLTPVAILILWMLINKITLGWYLWPFNINLYKANNLLDLDRLEYTLGSTFTQTNIMPIVTFFMLVALFAKKTKKNRIIVLFVIIALIYFIFYYLTSFLPRYLLFVYPLVFLCFFYFLSLFFDKKAVLVVFFITLVVLIHSTIYDYLDTKNIPGDQMISVFKVIELNKIVSSFIEKEYKDFRIVTVWPMYLYLKDPLLGYVDKGLDVIDYEVNSRLDYNKTKQNSIYVWSSLQAGATPQLEDKKILKAFYLNGLVIKIFEIK